jgi:hypothetical protein
MRRKIAEDVDESGVIDEGEFEDTVSQIYLNPVHDSEVERAIHLAEQGDVSFNDVGGAHYSLPQPVPLACVYVTTKETESMSDHYIIFIWNRNFAQIIEFLRLRLLSAVHSVLLITEKPLSSTQWFLVGRFVGIKVLIGSCSNTQLLIQAGAERCLGIVVFPQQVDAAARSNAPDAKRLDVPSGVAESASILIYNMAKKLKNNIDCFIEVAETRSFGFLTKDYSLFNMFGPGRSVIAKQNGANMLRFSRACRNAFSSEKYSRCPRQLQELGLPSFEFHYSSCVMDAGAAPCSSKTTSTG